MSRALGIEWSGDGATGLVLRRRGGSLALEHYVHLTASDLEAAGVDATSPGQLARAVAQRLQSRGARLTDAVLGVNGRDAIVRYSHLPPMPDWRLALLMEMEVSEVAERSGDALSSDFRVLQADGGGNLVLVALAKDARVQEGVDALKAAGATVRGAAPLAVALGDCARFLGEGADAGTTLALHVGLESTEFALLEAGELLFARSVAQGAAGYLERLQRLLGVDAAAAREVLQAGRTPAGDDLDELLRPAHQTVVTLAESGLDFARRQVRRKKLQPERILVSGLGARAPGLCQALQQALGGEAQAFDPLSCLDTERADRESREDAQRCGPEAALAAGLAMNLALPGATRVNLLPLGEKARLHFRERTAWLWVAAGLAGLSAVIALSTGAWGRSAQASRLARVQELDARLRARQQEHDALRAANDRTDGELAALAERTRPGLHLAALLATVGEVLPPSITLTELRMERDKEVEGAFSFEVRGTADNSQRNGVQAMRELEAALQQDPRVAEAQVLPAETQGAQLEFRLKLVPVGNPGAETNGKGGS